MRCDMENKPIKLYKKLLEIQKKIKGLKADTKSGGDKKSYMYLSGNKLLDYIKEEMNEQGVLLVPQTESVETELCENKYGTKEILYKVWFTYTWIDCESGETLVCKHYASGKNDMEKGVGSASTYSERYFILKFFHIQTDEDDVDSPEREKEIAERAEKEKAHQRIQEERKKDLDKQKENKQGQSARAKELETSIKKIAKGNEAVIQGFLMSYGLNKLAECSVQQLREIYDTISGGDK